MSWILASASPRRRELLEKAGYCFTVVPSGVEEPAGEGFPSAEAYAVYTAWLKAHDVAGRFEKWVLAADTVVAVEGKLLGKPADRAEARHMIRQLRGTRHEVWTGVCLSRRALGVELVAAERTLVAMRSLTEREVEAYLDTRLWEGKAGAYGIQDHRDPFVEVIEGGFTNVVGLPLGRVEALMALAVKLDSPPHSPR